MEKLRSRMEELEADISDGEELGEESEVNSESLKLVEVMKPKLRYIHVENNQSSYHCFSGSLIKSCAA